MQTQKDTCESEKGKKGLNVNAPRLQTRPGVGQSDADLFIALGNIPPEFSHLQNMEFVCLIRIHSRQLILNMPPRLMTLASLELSSKEPLLL